MATLQVGDTVPNFLIHDQDNQSYTQADLATSQATFINFISPNCPYCKEQLPILDAVATVLHNKNYRFVYVTPSLTHDLVKLSPKNEWYEDKEGKMRDLFKVSGYPTLFVVENDGKIRKVIAGLPQDLKSDLLNTE